MDGGIEGVMSRLRRELPRLRREYGVSRLRIFGSYVRGEELPDSDLDVLVEFESPPSLFRFVTLEQELSDVLGVSVDLVMRDGLKPILGRRILDEAVAV
jgi:uncharacterized protein